MSTVLSVIGTVFMVLLVVVLVLVGIVCFILFCPLFYKAEAGFKEKLTADGRICWLFGIIWIRFSYKEGDFNGIFRIFGMDVQKLSAWYRKRKEQKAEKKEIKKEKKRKKQLKVSQKTDNSSKQKKESTEKEVRRSMQNERSEEKSTEQKSIEEKSTEQKKAEADTAFGEPEKERKEQANLKKKSLFGMFYRKIKALPEKFMMLWNRLCSAKKGLKKILGQTEAMRKLWKSENTRKLVCIIKDNVLHLWRKLKPKVLRGNLVFGTGDPCSTGEILGIAAMFYAAYGRDIQVVPDFEQARFEGNLFVKGNFTLITIVVILIKVLYGGEWSRFRKEAEKLKEVF